MYVWDISIDFYLSMNYLDCAGGYFNKSINTMECYFLETQQWKRCADLQVSRSGVGVVSLHMRVYVIGGRHNTR